MQIILDIRNPNELQLVLQYVQLLSSVKVLHSDTVPGKTARKKTRRHTAKSLKFHQEIIARGGDGSYFGDASEWQRNERQDRDLPFR
jgi:hypothetical protein